MNKILTVCIAAYNAEKTISKTLNSMLKSNRRDSLELIVVDDGSKDGTGTIVKQYVEKYPDIVIYVPKENGGAGSARNVAFDYATGKYIKIIDADDEVVKENLDGFIENIEKLDVDVVWNGYYTNNISNGKCKCKDEYFKYVKPNVPYKIDEKTLTLPIDIAMHGITYRTSIIKENNIKLSENTAYTDLEYILFPTPYLRVGAYIDKPFYIYNKGDINQSVSGRNFVANEQKIKKLLIRLFNYKSSYPNVTNNQKHIMDCAISHACIFVYRIHIAKCDFAQKKSLVHFDNRLKDVDFDVWKLLPQISNYPRVCRMFNYNGYYLMLLAGKIKGLS